MGKHSQSRWSWALALLLLLAGLAPGLARGAGSTISPHASANPVTPGLDLAAMALTPIDLDDLGLPGFGQQTSAFLTLQEQADQLATTGSLGIDVEAVRSGLTTVGFQRRYGRQLGLPSRPG